MDTFPKLLGVYMHEDGPVNLYAKDYHQGLADGRRLALEEAAKVNLFPVVSTFEAGSPHAVHYQNGIKHMRLAIRALLDPKGVEDQPDVG
jgi:hypothetical protein